MRTTVVPQAVMLTIAHRAAVSMIAKECIVFVKKKPFFFSENSHIWIDIISIFYQFEHD